MVYVRRLYVSGIARSPRWSKMRARCQRDALGLPGSSRCEISHHGLVTILYQPHHLPHLPIPPPTFSANEDPPPSLSIYRAMFAQYSPLFTSGLLSDSPAASRTPSPNHLTHKYNRESLPLTVNTESTSFYDVFDSARFPDEEDSAIFLTFKPHRRQIDHGRSFLSLDLAESNSMRSMSLRRKDSVSTTAFFGRSEPSSPSPSSPVSPPLE